MEFLVETFPFVFGILLGLTCHRMGGVLKRWPLAAGGSVALGAFATLASGEWRVSPQYFAFDIGLVAAMCAASAWLLARYARRAARH
jgi:hypothetical protein